jgi:hypothetical protein
MDTLRRVLIKTVCYFVVPRYMRMLVSRDVDCVLTAKTGISPTMLLIRIKVGSNSYQRLRKYDVTHLQQRLDRTLGHPTHGHALLFADCI